jgi:hypothetical protein
MSIFEMCGVEVQRENGRTKFVNNTSVPVIVVSGKSVSGGAVRLEPREHSGSFQSECDVVFRVEKNAQEAKRAEIEPVKHFWDQFRESGLVEPDEICTNLELRWW